MYTYKYSVGRYRNYRPGYHIVDIADYSVADLEKLFDLLYIVIDDSMFKDKVCITLQDYRLDFAKNPTLTIQKWLDTKVNDVLTLSDVMPGDKYRYVKLERIFTYGYFHYPANINLANDRQDLLTSDGAPDIRIEQYRYQNIDYNHINDYALFQVNGVFTRSVGRKDGIYLLGAGLDYIKNRKDLRIGALNFQKIGKIKTIPITKDILQEVSTTSNKRWEIKVTDDLSAKTIYVVVNGQLLVDNSITYKVADNRIAIDLTSFDVIHHYFNYQHYTRTPKLTNLTKFDTYKQQALLADNSFIVLIDNPSVGVDVSPMTTFHYPTVLHTEEKFQHPLVVDNGMFPVPYIRTYGIGQRLWSHDLRIYNKYPTLTTGTLDGNVVPNDTVNPGNPGALMKGWMFKIHAVDLGKTR